MPRKTAKTVVQKQVTTREAQYVLTGTRATIDLIYLFCQSLQKLVAQHNALITSKISIRLLKLLTTPKKYETVATASLPNRKSSLSVLTRYNKNVIPTVKAKFLEVKARQNSTF